MMEITHSTEEPTRTSLLGLPLELRCMVYEHMLPIFDNHISESRGLLLACRQLHQEYKAEATKKIPVFTASITEKWKKAYGSELRLSVLAYQAVHVSIPLSFIRGTTFSADDSDSEGGETDGRFPPVLLPLIPLYTSCLWFFFYEDVEGKEPPTTMQHVEFLEHMYHIMKSNLVLSTDEDATLYYPHALAADRLRIEWGPDDWTYPDALPPLSFGRKTMKGYSWVESMITWGWEGNESSGFLTPPRDQYTWQTSEIVWDRLVDVEYDESGELVSRNLAKDQH